MSEKNLYNQLKNNWKHYIERIEPKDTSFGIPDCHLVGPNQNDIFIELKYLKKAFKNKILPIKKSQFLWHAKYKGRCAFVLFKIENCFYVIHSSQIKHLRGKIEFKILVDNSIVFDKDIKKIIILLEKII